MAYVEQESFAPSDDAYAVFGVTSFREKWISHSFVAGSSYTLTQLAVKIYKNGSPTDSITAAIYDGEETFHTPVNSLGESTNSVDLSTLSTTPGAYVNFTFAGVALTNGTRYHVILKRSTVGDPNYPGWRTDTSSQSQYQRYSADGGSWADTGGLGATIQGTFKTYIDGASPDSNFFFRAW